MPRVVVDTNVIATAYGLATQADCACVKACRKKITRLEKGQDRLVLDCGDQIYNEYMGCLRKLLNRDNKDNEKDIENRRLAAAFCKWIHDHQHNLGVVDRVPINPIQTTYQEFPVDPNLATFDQDDHKFVAVARAVDEQNPPPILNATDTDWWDYRNEFGLHNINIKFLCCQLMKKRTP